MVNIKKFERPTLPTSNPYGDICWYDENDNEYFIDGTTAINPETLTSFGFDDTNPQTIHVVQNGRKYIYSAFEIHPNSRRYLFRGPKFDYVRKQSKAKQAWERKLAAWNKFYDEFEGFAIPNATDVSCKTVDGQWI